MRLRDRATVITGATTGIGRATALRFAREGARLILAARNERLGLALAREIEAAGGVARFIATDVARREDNERMIDLCVELYGRLDILYCNAGVTLPKQLPDTSDAEIEQVLAVNLLGPVFACRYAVPIMLKQRPAGGVILIDASKTGLVAQVDSPIYCASKGAAVQLARALALDYAQKGIRVNALCPGIIDTPMLHEFTDAMPDPEASWADHCARQPIGRLGTAEECADAALWLCSDEASFITGVALPVDGGFTAM